MWIIETPTVHNAIIMGSGAGTGMATKVMADAGPKIAVVEASSFFPGRTRTKKPLLPWRCSYSGWCR